MVFKKKIEEVPTTRSTSAGLCVVIVTRNRAADLLRAVESVLAQRNVITSILIYDDASDERTLQELESKLSDPRVRFLTSKERRGYIYWRNQGFRDADTDWICSLDDDSELVDQDCLRLNLDLAIEREDTFAVALPFMEPNIGGFCSGERTLVAGQQVRSYVGCAHMIRRRPVLEAGGYRELLVHQTEERDLCIRMLDRGYKVIYGVGMPSVHHCSPARDRERLNYYGYRNTILVTGLNAPIWLAIPRMLVDTLLLIRYRFSLFRVRKILLAISSGWIGVLKYRNQYERVSYASFRMYYKLPSCGPICRSVKGKC